MKLNSSINSLNLLLFYPDRIEINHPVLANWICKLIPEKCPFERKFRCFGYTIFQIPPLCKLNPCYEQLVALRFKALVYLSNEELQQSKG